MLAYSVMLPSFPSLSLVKYAVPSLADKMDLVSILQPRHSFSLCYLQVFTQNSIFSKYLFDTFIRLFNHSIYYVSGNALPLEVVESLTFKNLVAAIRESHVCPLNMVGDIRNLIRSRSLERKQTVKDKLKCMTSFCLSEELCKPLINGKHYATLSVHYIQDWTYNHFLVLSKEINAREDSVEHEAVTTFTQVYAEFQPSALECIICNLSQEQALPGFGSMTKIPVPSPYNGATAYNNAFINEVGNAIILSLQDPSQNRAMQLVNKASNLLLNKGANWQCNVNQATQWFEQLKLLEVVFARSEEARNELNADECLLDAAEMIELRKVLDVLKPFQDVMDRFITAPDNVCMGSLVVPYRKLLIQTLTELEAKHSDSTFLQCLQSMFIQRTEFVEEKSVRATIYTTSTTLDPRFKLRWCDDTDYDMYKDHLILLAKNTMQLKSEPKELTNPNGLSTSVFAKILKRPLESSEDAVVATEVLRYLREPIITEDSDVLNYWKQNELNFPSLSMLARKYLAIPTSAADLKNARPNIATAENNLSGQLLESIVELSCKLDV